MCSADRALGASRAIGGVPLQHSGHRSDRFSKVAGTSRRAYGDSNSRPGRLVSYTGHAGAEAGDRVVIASQVEIVLLAVKSDRAHIGAIAPEGVAIARGEVYGERSPTT